MRWRYRGWPGNETSDRRNQKHVERTKNQYFSVKMEGPLGLG
uniref:Uncharacterized protein n=1 Tax=Sphingobacterium sp. (strain 21) TaxID=743722 RepID=F4CFH7_SPHS2